jgi:hypothetical protein
MEIETDMYMLQMGKCQKLFNILMKTSYCFITLYRLAAVNALYCQLPTQTFLCNLMLQHSDALAIFRRFRHKHITQIVLYECICFNTDFMMSLLQHCN